MSHRSTSARLPQPGLRAAVEVGARRRPAPPVILLSRYVERTQAAALPADGEGGIGYLLKDRHAPVSGEKHISDLPASSNSPSPTTPTGEYRHRPS
ncbi:hypothetical protein ABZY20_36705 [Streptomyces sp. NPDC006624]|uniref:hypothetical protein n=1 Tax=Streptomyces sp. NPDC006624 TaxID=3154892 RepID=UPI0033AC901C